MMRRPPRATRTDTLLPYTTLFRSDERWVAPQRSLGAIDTLLRASYDLQPQPVATDYLAAATGLSLRQRRRGLLMLRSEEHTSALPSLMRISYAVFCLKQKQNQQ